MVSVVLCALARDTTGKESSGESIVDVIAVLRSHGCQHGPSRGISPYRGDPTWGGEAPGLGDAMVLRVWLEIERLGTSSSSVYSHHHHHYSFYFRQHGP